MSAIDWLETLEDKVRDAAERLGELKEENGALPADRGAGRRPTAPSSGGQRRALGRGAAEIRERVERWRGPGGRGGGVKDKGRKDCKDVKELDGGVALSYGL